MREEQKLLSSDVEEAIVRITSDGNSEMSSCSVMQPQRKFIMKAAALVMVLAALLMCVFATFGQTPLVLHRDSGNAVQDLWAKHPNEAPAFQMHDVTNYQGTKFTKLTVGAEGPTNDCFGTSCFEGYIDNGPGAGFTEYAHVNCHEGHGGTLTNLSSSYEEKGHKWFKQGSATKTVEHCAFVCESAVSSCKGFLYNFKQKQCFVLSHIDLDSCERASPHTDSYSLSTYVIDELSHYHGFANVACSPGHGGKHDRWLARGPLRAETPQTCAKECSKVPWRKIKTSFGGYRSVRSCVGFVFNFRHRECFLRSWIARDLSSCKQEAQNEGWATYTLGGESGASSGRSEKPSVWIPRDQEDLDECDKEGRDGHWFYKAFKTIMKGEQVRISGQDTWGYDSPLPLLQGWQRPTAHEVCKALADTVLRTENRAASGWGQQVAASQQKTKTCSFVWDCHCQTRSCKKQDELVRLLMNLATLCAMPPDGHPCSGGSVTFPSKLGDMQLRDYMAQDNCYGLPYEGMPSWKSLKPSYKSFLQKECIMRGGNPSSTFVSKKDPLLDTRRSHLHFKHGCPADSWVWRFRGCNFDALRSHEYMDAPITIAQMSFDIGGVGTEQAQHWYLAFVVHANQSKWSSQPWFGWSLPSRHYGPLDMFSESHNGVFVLELVQCLQSKKPLVSCSQADMSMADGNLTTSGSIMSSGYDKDARLRKEVLAKGQRTSKLSIRKLGELAYRYHDHIRKPLYDLADNNCQTFVCYIWNAAGLSPYCKTQTETDMFKGIVAKAIAGFGGGLSAAGNQVC
eukprot:TRINITY_DN48113_c0_g1_i1.p1 TRINITY_DN48113_c0_g1~~TRINITY_DN48113_c0_g1_i1.p1  ORF type:complete len:793 (-),score=80.17 TRINITY_DN48113_c0_g1_i1:49-2427(-)